MLDPSLPEVHAAAGESRRISTELRARPHLQHLERALARTAPRRPDRPPACEAVPA